MGAATSLTWGAEFGCDWGGHLLVLNLNLNLALNLNLPSHLLLVGMGWACFEKTDGENGALG